MARGPRSCCDCGKCYKLIPCPGDLGGDSSIITDTDLSAYLGKVVSYQGKCYYVRAHGNCDGAISVSIEREFDDCADCGPCYELTPCSEGTTIITNTDVSDDVGGVIKLVDGYCYEVSESTACVNAVPVNVDTAGLADCNACETCYRLTPCSKETGEPVIYTKDDLSDYIGSIISIGGVCYGISTQLDCPSTQSVTIDGEWGSCILCNDCSSGTPCTHCPDSTPCAFLVTIYGTESCDCISTGSGGIDSGTADGSIILPQFHNCTYDLGVATYDIGFSWWCCEDCTCGPFACSDCACYGLPPTCIARGHTNCADCCADPSYGPCGPADICGDYDENQRRLQITISGSPLTLRLHDSLGDFFEASIEIADCHTQITGLANTLCTCTTGVPTCRGFADITPVDFP